MEELPSLLLPLLILAMAMEAVLSEAGRFAGRFRRILASGILLLSALVAFVTGPLEFHGPILFVLDSFHQVEFRLQADWLPLGLVGIFVWLSVCKVPTNPNRLLTIAMALFVLADNFGLQLLAGGWLFVLLVDECIRKQKSIGLDTGLGLFAMIFLMLCLGLLAFDLEAESWSELTSSLRINENWSAHELSSLKLSSYFLIFSSVILVGLAPFQAFWITSNRQEHRYHSWSVLQFVLAIALLDRGRELLIWASTSQFAVSLSFVTFLMTAFCAPFQRESQRVVRTMIASHFALAMTGILATDEIAFEAGVCHAIVSCVVFVVLSSEVLVRSRCMRTMSLLIPFGGISGAYLLLNSATPVGIGLELTGLIAWLVLGLTQTHHVRNMQSSALERSTSMEWIPVAMLLGIPPVVMWGSVLMQIDILSGIERVWLIPEVMLAGMTGIAIGWSMGCSRPTGDQFADRVPGVARIFEQHFYLREFVLATIRVPAGICLVLFECCRTGFFRVIQLWDKFRSRQVAPHDESVRWELLRGFMCVTVLLIVFLWMGR